MDATPAATLVPTIPGTPYAGGFYVGRIRIDGQFYALIRAPKASGQHKPTRWNKTDKAITGADAFDDGLRNTQAMAAAGSAVAKWALGKTINDQSDWYIPSQDELEIAYRALKPGKRANWLYSRSGMNLSAEPPTRPYMKEFPQQTEAVEFQTGGSEAFDEAWYWTSTQYAAGSDYAWVQTFVDGYQNGLHKNDECSVFLVRRELIR